MCPGAALRREYRRCVEREALRGRAGACGDAALAAALRGRLRREPALLAALHGDAAALLAAGLRGRRELGPALRSLAAAFELLELAALNLYLFPWRREFGTIKTFSGAYVHGLRAALPEAELARSFARLGYARRDEQHLALARPPPAPQLAAAACGFFALRLECELLAEALLRLLPRRPRAPQLLRARRLADGLDACVEALRRGGAPRPCRETLRPGAAEEPPQREVAGEPEPQLEREPPRRTVGLYREPPPRDAATPDPYWELPQRDGVTEDLYRESAERGAVTEDLYRESAERDAGTEDLYQESPQHDAGTEDLYEGSLHCNAGTEDLYEGSTRCDAAQGADPYWEAPASPEDTGPDPEALVPLPAAGARGLPRDPRGAQDGPGGGRDTEAGRELLPAAPAASPVPRGAVVQSPPCSPPGALPALPRYELHSCVRRGALPSYCCRTCQQLHAGACAALPACRSRHRGQELRGEQQQRLWLQRSEVDRLLGPGASTQP